MEKGWKEVLLTAQEYQAHIARDILEGAGIKTVVMDKQDSTYMTFGEYHVYVPEGDEQAALELLKDLKN